MHDKITINMIYTPYSSWLFFIVRVELKANPTCRFSCLFSLFLFFSSQLTFFHGLFIPYCNSIVCLAVLFLEIIPKTILNRIIALYNLLIKKTSHMQCTLTLWLQALITKKNWVSQFSWMNISEKYQWMTAIAQKMLDLLKDCYLLLFTFFR